MQNIDRLVDGELNRNAEREFLLECEANNSWRDLALAFIESRALEQEMKGLMSAVRDTAPNRDSKVQPSSPRKPRPEQTTWDAWSLAAAVLLSLGIGYGMGWGWQRTTSGASEFVAEQPIHRPTNQTINPASNRPASMQFMVDHPATRELQQVEIPLLQATDLGPDWQQRLQTNSWDRIVDDMRRQGLNLRQERTITPVRLSNGQRVVVPVDYFYEQPYQ